MRVSYCIVNHTSHPWLRCGPGLVIEKRPRGRLDGQDLGRYRGYADATVDFGEYLGAAYALAKNTRIFRVVKNVFDMGFLERE